MPDSTVVIAVAVTVVIVVALELASAVLPILIVVVFVPPDERAALAQLIAATDSSRRLRVWPALKVAVLARRSLRSAADSPAPAYATRTRTPQDSRTHQ